MSCRSLQTGGHGAAPNTCSEGGCQGFFIFSRAMYKAEKQGSPAALECLERDRFIVRGAILPTPIEDTNPFKR
jgi:hypothetical protein